MRNRHCFLTLLFSCLCVCMATAQDFEVMLRFLHAESSQGPTPYVAGTLEPKSLPADPWSHTEPLVINLEGVDCTTLVEYVSAFVLAHSLAGDSLIGHTKALAMHEGYSLAPDSFFEQKLQAGDSLFMQKMQADDSLFMQKLQALRYRGGVRGNYATRKHYFSEWISDGEAQGLLHELTSGLKGSRPLRRTINFMSQHAASYPQLQACKRLMEEVVEVERRLSAQQVSYIPSAQINEAYPQLKHGDIVAFVTDLHGLDIQHVGFVWQPNGVGEPRLYHASSRLGRVTISDRSLQAYAQGLKHCIGIRVVRLGAK